MVRIGRCYLLILLAIAGVSMPALPAFCADATTSGAVKTDGEPSEVKVDLSKLSLEELMNIEVTIASKKPEAIMDTSSAVYVLTAEDIKRSGVTNIPDALRLVPGMDVARTNASTWAVSCRGFNDDFANKLLVLMDGRTIYNPLFGGVYWDVQDTVMENIDRIEVVRGPGATMWGADAVNGVINIIMKPAVDTQGTIVAETGGSLMQNISTVRHGGKVGSDSYYRVYGQYSKTSSFDTSNGDSANDSWNLMQGGFRVDWDASHRDSVMFTGDFRAGTKHLPAVLTSIQPPYKELEDVLPLLSGGYLISRWTRTRSEKSDFSLQLYYDVATRSEAYLKQIINTFDLDFQQHIALSPRNSLIWGVEYRLVTDHLTNTFNSSFYPSTRNIPLYSAFVQDDVTVIPDRFRLTFGSKFEHNVYTGFEVQPTVRFLWTPDSQRSGWAAVSRAVRTPTEFDTDSRENIAVFPDPRQPGLFDFLSILGSSNFKSEELIAYEIGYRQQMSSKLFLDLATFYNVYNELRSFEPGTPFFEPSPPPPHLTIPIYLGNKMYGQSYGFEVMANWQPRDWWRVVSGYTFLGMDLHLDADSRDTRGLSIEGRSPRNQFYLRSSVDLPNKVEFDTILRYVDALLSSHVPSYVEMDIRLAWKPSKGPEISIVGQNLLQNRHLEFVPFEIQYLNAEVPRSVYGKVTWTF